MRVHALVSLVLLVILAVGCMPPNRYVGGEADSLRNAPTNPPETPAPAPEPEEKNAGGIAWFTNLTDAQERARLLDRPILVDFYADWCGPCRMLDEKTWPDPSVVKASERFVCARLDVDVAKNAAAKFQVRAIPTIVIASPEGRILERATGFRDAAGMVTFLNSVQ